MEEQDIIDRLKEIGIEIDKISLEEIIEMIPVSLNISKIEEKDNLTGANKYMIEGKEPFGKMWQQLDNRYGNNLKLIAAEMLLITTKKQ